MAIRQEIPHCMTVRRRMTIAVSASVTFYSHHTSCNASKQRSGIPQDKKKALLPGILNLHITVGFKMFNGIQDSVCDDIFESAFIYIFIFLQNKRLSVTFFSNFTFSDTAPSLCKESHLVALNSLSQSSSHTFSSVLSTRTDQILKHSTFTPSPC